MSTRPDTAKPMSAICNPPNASIERWRRFSVRDAGVLVTAWCIGLVCATQLDKDAPPGQRLTDAEYLLWGFCIGGVLASAFVFFWQRDVERRTVPLSLGEWLAFYPIAALALGTTVFLVVLCLTIVFNAEPPFFAIGIAVIAVVHYGVGLIALALLFVPSGRLACPWAHRLGCWNAILSVVCVLLYTYCSGRGS